MEMHLHVATLLANLLENQFKIGKFRFGLDPILGAIPGIGDVISLVLSLYIVWIALQLKLPQESINKMIKNVLTDFIIGLVPVVGDIADIFHRANTKNLHIIKSFTNSVVEADLSYS